MDVQSPSAVAGTTAADGAQPAQAAVVGSTTTAAVTVVAQQPSPNDTGDAQGSTTIAPTIAKLFSAANAAPATLSVSYRIEGGDVVTVFTDPHTHKEVAQFPPELLLGLAQFFDQQSGVTFDRSA